MSTRRSSSSIASSRANLLFLDLVGARRSLAIVSSNGSWTVAVLPAALSSDHFLPSVASFLQARRLKPSSLAGCVVVSGKGSFSEIRANVAIANALGFALHVPVVGVVRRGEETNETLVRRARLTLGRLDGGFSLARPSYDRRPNITIMKSRPGSGRLRRHASAGGIVLDQKNRVLLIWNRTHDQLTIPHGHPDGEESSLAAARREVREETGYRNLTLLRRLPAVRYRFEEGGKPAEHREERFLFRLSSARRARVDPAKGGRGAIWAPLADAIRRVPYPNVRHQLRLVTDWLRSYGRPT